MTQLPFPVNRSCHTWIPNNRMNDTWLLVVCRVLVLVTMHLHTIGGGKPHTIIWMLLCVGWVMYWGDGVGESDSPIARILSIIILVVSGIWYTNGNVVSQKSRHEWVRHWELSTKDSLWFPVWLLLVPVLHFPHNLFAVIRLLQLCRVVCHSFSPVDVSGPVPT